MTNDTDKKIVPIEPSAIQHTPIQQRLFDSCIDILDSPRSQPVFQHSIFCQTCLPYKNPGDHIVEWRKKNGNAHLIINAGKVFNPETENLEVVGLPYGSKARLVLSHINTEAVKNQSPIIDVEGSITAFLRRINLAKNGRNIKIIRDQITRLSASLMYFVLNEEECVFQEEQKIISSFSFWKNKGEHRHIEVDQKYFQHLLEHAVPLEERALAALSHNCMALDTYQWLAHRLHRVKRGGQFIPWTAVKEQFGSGYNGPMAEFRRGYNKTLKIVLTQYIDAKIKSDGKGITLYNSPPPIAKILVSVPKDISS